MTPRLRPAGQSPAGSQNAPTPHTAPDGRLPVYPWRQAPAGYATRRQLRAQGLRPGGQPVAAEITCRRGRRTAHLYLVDLALPVRIPTLAQEAALDRAMAARQTCPVCHVRYYYCLPLRTLGSCWACHRRAARAELRAARCISGTIHLGRTARRRRHLRTLRRTARR